MRLKHLKWHIFIGLSLILTASLIAVLIVISHSSSFPKGLQLGEWNIGNYNKQQFEQEWERKRQDWENFQFAIRSPEPFKDQTNITFSELGLYIDTELIEHDLEKLLNGRIWERVLKQFSMRNKTYPLVIRIHEEKLVTAVENNWKPIQTSKPVDAVRIVGPNDQIIYQQEKPGYRIDLDYLRETLLEQAYTRSIEWLREIESSDHDRQDSATAIALQLIPFWPETTVTTLKQEKIERKIAQFTTHYRTDSAGRVHNIQSTAKTIHDRILKPNEIFDFSEVVKETEKKFGFKPAPVILNGKMVPGVGGGICQVSTTLYNAALLSGLEIVERRPHSLPIQYVPLGLDATFASGHINFRFKNHEQSHLLIRIEIGSSYLTVKLFGSLPPKRSYKIETKITETIPAPVQYVQNRALAPGQSVVVRKGKSGHRVETIRIQLDGGKETKRELISRDLYKPQPALIAVNRPVPKKAPSSRPPIIEDGVSGPIR